MKSDLTAEEVRAYYNYDPDSGVFTHATTVFSGRGRNIKSAWPGKVAGRKSTCGYWVLNYKGGHYQAHRVAWLYFYGQWPESILDHRDGNPLNNSIYNLREATHTQSNANRRVLKTSKSGIKGVYFDEKTGKYSASITRNGKTKKLGTFTTASKAEAAYLVAAASIFGVFARRGDA